MLEPDVIGMELELERYDLSLEHRRETSNAVVEEAAAAMKEAGFGLKAATVTPEGKDDVGSPNRIVREGVDGKVIIRTGRRIPGVTPIAGVHHPISVVRMAVEDAYGAKQWREGTDGAPGRGRLSHREDHALDLPRGGRVRLPHGGADGRHGLRRPEVDRLARSTRACSRRSSTTPRRATPRCPTEPVLIDATYAGLISSPPEMPLVIPALNRDGDCLSDLVMPMFGSIAGAESVLLAFDERVRDPGRDGRGAPRHRAGAPGQGRRQSDGHDPGLRRRPALRGRARLRGRRTARRAPSTSRCSRRARPASARPTWAATPPRRASPARSSRACARRSTSGPRWARASSSRLLPPLRATRRLQLPLQHPASVRRPA